MNLNTCVLNGVSRESYFIIYERELKCDEVWTNKSAWKSNKNSLNDFHKLSQA